MQERSVFKLLGAALLVSSVTFAQAFPDRHPRPFRGQAWSGERPAAPLWQPSFAVTKRASNLPQTVSVHELQHKVPGKARKEYDKGHKLMGQGKMTEAIDCFAKAVQIDPEFVDAQNDLAAALLREGKSDQALDHLKKAIEADPQSVVAYSNLSVAHLLKQNFAEAEMAARRSVDLDRTSGRPRFILALTLVMARKFSEETATLLRRSEAMYPQATLLLGRTLAANGDLEGARSKIEDYLKTDDTSGRGLAREWLKVLKATTNEQAAAVGGAH